MTTRGGEYRHLELFDSRDWGLIVYDEVHLLPHRSSGWTADLSPPALGWTATLIREDARGDVFSLIGPKPTTPRGRTSNQGWIAPADCTEVTGDTHTSRADGLPPRARGPVPHLGDGRTKLPVIKTIVDQHPTIRCSSSVAYLDQLDDVWPSSMAPRSPGLDHQQGARCASTTSSAAASNACWSFRRWPTSRSTCRGGPSRPDLRDVRLAAGEAQRLGRVLRPSRQRQAHFYTVVARDTWTPSTRAPPRFLAEQGYAIHDHHADDLLRPDLEVAGRSRATR